MISEHEKQSIAASYKEEGFLEGMEKGMEKGIEKGIEQGIEQGICIPVDTRSVFR